MLAVTFVNVPIGAPTFEAETYPLALILLAEITPSTFNHPLALILPDTVNSAGWDIEYPVFIPISVF